MQAHLDARQRVAQVVCDHARHAAHDRQCLGSCDLAVSFLQFLFQPLTLGNIHYGGKDHSAFLCVDRIESDLERNFFAVLSATIQILSDPHCQTLAFSKKSRSVPRVRSAIAFGYQHFHRLADQFLARIAKNPLRLKVGQHDLALPVYHHDPVRGGLDHATKSLLKPHAFSNVLFDRDEVRNFALCISNRRDAGRFPIKLTILFLVMKYTAPLTTSSNGFP